MSSSHHPQNPGNLGSCDLPNTKLHDYIATFFNTETEIKPQENATTFNTKVKSLDFY